MHPNLLAAVYAEVALAPEAVAPGQQEAEAHQSDEAAEAGRERKVVLHSREAVLAALRTMVGRGRVSKKGVSQGDVSGGAHDSLLRNHTSPVLRGELRLGGGHSRAISRGGEGRSRRGHRNQEEAPAAEDIRCAAGTVPLDCTAFQGLARPDNQLVPD